MRRIVTWTWMLGMAAACGGGGEAEEGSSPAVVDSAAYQRRVVGELQPGMTKDEVRQRLGEPRTRVTMGGGLERWTYYNYDMQGQIAARTLIIFGNDDKIAEINDM
jgi:outer membrane protein assembly factor BamE (lipoprotein component of BamABCDE complex)